MAVELLGDLDVAPPLFARRLEACLPGLLKIALRAAAPGVRRSPRGLAVRRDLAWLPFLEPALACELSAAVWRNERAALALDGVELAPRGDELELRLLVAVGFVERRPPLVMFRCCIVACGNLKR